ncbi:LIM domain-containing protein PLIM2c [Arabidopsis thaliana]|uniref:LIM domain-containing protein PLIM2c n=4 Tax=Arabidopsis TaxID=3701 RepID=PLI2C_ARATH|nr:GATA type zinc finger transcription factor family protein [Arabidopsis thaliana]Q500W4.1 RecName: Full=LIM domain-containing protein PLIM2c; AltName: Full=Pollen-expressed LIM protein 2C [Arabidopsis thaliana]KAG7629277.1 Zinc finger LIM-type [Arabidopsis thaliana x Arabidopsis arenosa]KAG7635204.1 Zinc finger LIM-type [Arabidopsis suecica]AAY34164.1 At3g61230 [Arabidopsis thaliana]AEE80176.1 GATA type zinc finger transcription factor family protein [Arabidopsis thaliana]OAP03438.1 PLIM2c |eukprot:NP_191682.2 GATA type zinc finger transcription factor family protein [Arabidopsis thaliana]
MAAFTGTTDKCKACDKTVYVMDLMTLEGMPYHKSCFRCSHCNGTLVICNYSSMDGVLYCKTHFEQLFKESGNFSKNFQTAGKTEKSNDATKAPNRLSSFFSGTQDKCAACKKTVYPLEKMTMEGESYHKTCFRCAHSGCPLTHSSYAALDGVLYCKVHFSQLFLEKGNYNHVLQAAANHRRSTAEEDKTEPKEDEANPTEEETSDAAAEEHES